MTHKTAPSPRIFPIILLIALLITACSPKAAPDSMSLEEALSVQPDDGRPTVLEEMGPPDAFTIEFQELEGQVVRWETWSYFDFNTQFDFIDGELLWTVELEEVEDGSIYAHWYHPLDFQAGMSQAEVESLLLDQELLEVDLGALDLEGGLLLAGDQILLGFQDDQLAYVETVILSPDPDGEPLAELPDPQPELEPTQEPTIDPTPEPTLAPTPQPTAVQRVSFEDDFEGEDPLAIPLFGESVMEYGVIDGEGVLTSHFPGGILLVYYPQPELKDFILEVEIRPLGFAEGSSVGILFRSEYPDGGADYYQMIAVLPIEGQIAFRTWQGGEWAQVELQPIPEDLLPAYGIYQLKIDCQGDQIQVFLGDELAAEFTSSLILEPGYFGLAITSARDPETVAFDNLIITDHP